MVVVEQFLADHRRRRKLDSTRRRDGLMIAPGCAEQKLRICAGS